MKVFMLGWEFPPFISGGLGTACYGMTRGLDDIGVEVCFVLPHSVPVGQRSHVSFRGPVTLTGVPDAGPDAPATNADFQTVTLHQVDAALQPYQSPQPPLTEEEVRELTASVQGEGLETAEDIAAAAQVPQGHFQTGRGAHYHGDLMGQVHRYARLAVELSRRETFDVVHAHDWMTYPAGMAVAAASHKPLIVHVHSTEFDRSGENVNQQVYEIERAGMQAADRVVAVSHLTRGVVLRHYGVPPEKVEVVYNAVDMPDNGQMMVNPIQSDEKLVLFLGRVTMQKGPEYFLQAARKVVDRLPNVRFVMAGSGDMIRMCIELAAELRLGRHVTFTGFLHGQDVDRVFRMADLYVMPSVSEPFGIAPLEAMSRNVPVIISRQSGVSELLTHALKVDFWDIDQMADKILAVLRHPPLQKTLSHHGQIDLRKFSWTDSARKLSSVYDALCRP